MVGPNVYHPPNGSPTCIACKRERQRGYRMGIPRGQPVPVVPRKDRPNHRPTDPDKLLAKIPHVRGACVIWTGTKDRKGYGAIRVNGVWQRAHRLIYVGAFGPIPDGLVVDHLCRNTSCININHLEAVTRRVNTLRGDAPSASNYLRTECKRGHPFDENNTKYWKRKNGVVTRRCHACRSVDIRARNAQLKIERKARRTAATEALRGAAGEVSRG